MRSRAIASVAFLVGSVLAVPYGAAPHDQYLENTYGRAQWKGDHHPPGLDVGWRFNASFPNGQKRDHVMDAFAKWNAQGQNLQFEKRTEDSTDYSFLCSDYQEYNGVFFEDIPFVSTVFGWGRTCTHEGPAPEPVHNFFVVFDPDGPWYSGTEKSDIGNGQIDFKGTAVHETGHATGWKGHLGGSYCDGSPSISQTMCSAEGFGYYGPGTYEMRTLEEHDRHTFDSAYVDE